MPPKPKDNIKKPTQIATRPIISNSSLLRIPENAVEGNGYMYLIICLNFYLRNIESNPGTT